MQHHNQITSGMPKQRVGQRLVALHLFLDLRRSGVKLSTRGSRLRYRGPSQQLTPEIIQAIRENKAALVSMIKRDWYGAAGAMIASLGDPDEQLHLRSDFELSAAVNEHILCLSRRDAEHLATLQIAGLLTLETSCRV
jgi:hypothetical protein